MRPATSISTPLYTFQLHMCLSRKCAQGGRTSEMEPVMPERASFQVRRMAEGIMVDSTGAAKRRMRCLCDSRMW